ECLARARVGVTRRVLSFQIARSNLFVKRSSVSGIPVDPRHTLGYDALPLPEGMAMAVLPGMKAGGYYDQHSSYQRVTVESFAPWIDQAVAGMALPKEEHPFTVADYGCSEGINSILAIGRVMEAFRRRRPEQAACAIHSDLPTNNFN